MIDTHSHPQFPQYDSDRPEVVRRAFEEDIKIICVGTDFEMSEKAISLAHQYQGIWATVGLHPNDNLSEDFDAEAYYQLGLDKKVVAFGEIGLDYYRTKDPRNQISQKRRFLQQIAVASELNLPLIIHCRDAHDEMLAALNDQRAATGAKGGVIHSFTGNWQQAQKYFDLGFLIGLNGIITFTDQYNETIVKAPLDKILLETDAPFLAPVPYRGQRNEPAYVKFVAEKIAVLRNISVAEIVAKTTENANKLFNLGLDE